MSESRKGFPVPAERSKPITGQEKQILIPPISTRRQARIKEVQELHNAGWTIKEISLRFDVHVRQIYRDLEDAKYYNRFLVSDLDADNIVGREILFLEASRRKELRKYETTTNSMAAATHMRNAIVIHEKLIKLLQEYGLMEKVPDRFSLDAGNPFDDPEFKAAYKKLMIEARQRGIKINGF